MKQDFMSAFQDTQKLLWENEQLCQLTMQSVMCTQVFPEGYDTTRVVGSYATGISVTDETALQAANRMKSKYVKVALLNFANAVTPGGNVYMGEDTAETELCCRSNLYACLTKPALYESFYGYNNLQSPYFSDRIIYSPNVTVFKTDKPNYTYSDKWWQVDVLTCPAPNLNGVSVPDFHKLEKLYQERIRNILAVAEAHGVQALVLGAFGCDIYLNPPELVAKAFYKEIMHGDYKKSFREIVFAVKTNSPQAVYNLSVFRSILSPWQKNPLYGKKVSILGDSISTYWGSSPEGYRSFYNGEQCLRANMYSVNDIWWKILLDKLGGTLLMNNSCAGSCVSGNSNFSGNNDNRIYHLCNGYESPDVILISMGMSDFEYGVQIEPDAYDYVTFETFHQYFRTSYQTMLWKLRQAYPEAEIYCATIKYGIYDGNTDYLYINGRKGFPLREYNRVIRECAVEYGCNLVDVDVLVKQYDTMDGIHPNAQGMMQIAEGWTKAMNNPESVFYFADKKEEKNWMPVVLGISVGALMILLILLLVMILLMYQ